MEEINLVSFKNVPIFRQLQLEEALLRTDEKNWCLFNTGAPPSIVMGISGKPKELVHLDKWSRSSFPLIKRFSGGGTVFIDENTLFVTIICNHTALAIKPFPDHVMKWKGSLYSSLLPQKTNVKENDFVIDDKKFAGNAQYFTKKRWLHHSSILWDYNQKNMEVLTLPNKMSNYRKRREHKDFLISLKEFIAEKETVFSQVKEELASYFAIKEVSLSAVDKIVQRPHRKTSRTIPF